MSFTSGRPARLESVLAHAKVVARFKDVERLVAQTKSGGIVERYRDGCDSSNSTIKFYWRTRRIGGMSKFEIGLFSGRALLLQEAWFNPSPKYQIVRFTVSTLTTIPCCDDMLSGLTADDATVGNEFLCVTQRAS